MPLSRTKFQKSFILSTKKWIRCFSEKNQVNSRGKSGDNPPPSLPFSEALSLSIYLPFSQMSSLSPLFSPSISLFSTPQLGPIPSIPQSLHPSFSGWWSKSKISPKAQGGSILEAMAKTGLKWAGHSEGACKMHENTGELLQYVWFGWQQQCTMEPRSNMAPRDMV